VVVSQRSRREEQGGHRDEQAGGDDPHLADAAIRGGEPLLERHEGNRGEAMSIRQ